MKKELQTEQIAKFALRAKYEDINEGSIEQLKRHLLDALGSLFYASGRPTIQKLSRQIRLLSDCGDCRTPLVGTTSYDRAAQLYTALIRYPDFMDNYMGKEATCHPSDNIGSLLALSQLKETSGKDFLTAMAIAYQIECRLVNEIPVMIEGIDHTLLLAYSIAAAAARFVGLTEEQAAHALAIAGCSISPMVTSRASYTYEWKGLASSLDAFDCINILFMAQQGLTGPLALFEGPKGFKEIFNMDLDYDWSKENFELIPKCTLKEFNAEVHSQSALEAIVELKHKHNISGAEVEKIDITTFLTAYHIIGSGAYGDRKKVATKEQADHSLFYLAAVALLDGEIYPEQLVPERILKPDVQQLLQKVFVDTKSPIHKPIKLAGILDPYTEFYSNQMKSKVKIHLTNGQHFECEKIDYYGFYTRPFDWKYTIDKFKRLSKDNISNDIQEEIINFVMHLETKRNISPLVDLICKI